MIEYDFNVDELNINQLIGAGPLGAVLAIISILFAMSGIALSLPGIIIVVLEVGLFYLLYSLLTLSLNLQYGYTRLINFGVVGFFAVGAYATAMLTAKSPFVGIGLGYPWFIGIIAAIIAATIFGAIVGITTLRLREDFLAIATLAAAEIVYTLSQGYRSIFGATTGITNVPTPFSRIAANFDSGMVATVLFLAGIVSIIYAIMDRLTSAPYGRVLRGIRADEDVTQALGKDTFSYKMQVFLLGSAVSGLAGGLFALINGAIAPSFFTIHVTILVWVGLVLGGPGNHKGVLGGLAIIMSFRLVSRFLGGAIPVSESTFSVLRLIAIGLVLIVIVRYRPEGLWGTAEKLGVDR